MNRARIIFILLSVYIFAAFGWWTYAHILSTKKIIEQEKDVLEMKCYKATFDLHGAIDQELFNDSTDMQKYFNANFPELELVILDVYAPLDEFMVRPGESSYAALNKTYLRKITMYIAEGAVMILLLFWGMLVIYKSFKKELHLNKMQTNFLLAVTHELKTPLTAMKLYLETLLKRKMNPEQTQTIIHNSLNEAKRLQDQVDHLLLSAQLDSKKYQLDSQLLNISELVEEIVADFNRPRAMLKLVDTEIQEQVFTKADPGAIEMVLNNLLSNAIKYAGENAEIKVILKQLDKEVVIEVKDNGPGIPDSDKPFLFSKFYRMGDENTRKTTGAGLGLFIVKHLVNLHKGKISVLDNQPKGTTFEIKLNADAN